MQWVRPKLDSTPLDGASGAPGAEGGRPAGHNGGGTGSGGDACRLNLLLSYAGWDDESWADRLPVLLTPMGVRAVRAGSGREAADVIRALRVHIAVVDLGLPLSESRDGSADEGGVRLLEVLRRLREPPPTIVVKGVRGGRDDERQIACALRMGAFAVIDRPRDARGIELMLDLFRRVLNRHYRSRWPGAEGGLPGA